MIKYPCIFLLLWNVNVNAQLYKPLDTIPKEKKILLIKFSDFFAVETTAEKSISSFRKNFDPMQKSLDPTLYMILDLEADTLKTVPIGIIKSLDKKVFSIYILSLYSRALTTGDLKAIDSISKTKTGKELMIRMQQIYEGKENSEENFGSIFNDTNSYYFFRSIHEKLDLVFENILETLLIYIDEKTRTDN